MGRNACRYGCEEPEEQLGQVRISGAWRTCHRCSAACVIYQCKASYTRMVMTDGYGGSLCSRSLHYEDDYSLLWGLLLKRCTRSLSKPRSYEETMRCRFDPALEPMPAEATHLSPPCCVSTHRSRVVEPDGPTTFLDHREARFGIPQMTSFP